MALRRITTSQYDDDARIRLAKAVARAREAAGFKSRPAFAEVSGVSVRSLANLEQAVPRIGQQTLEAVARALPGWTEDTPRIILDGGDAPSEPAGPSQADLYAAAVYDLATIIATDAPTSHYVAALGRWQARLGETANIQAIASEARELASNRDRLDGMRAELNGPMNPPTQSSTLNTRR